MSVWLSEKKKVVHAIDHTINAVASDTIIGAISVFGLEWLFK